MAIHNELGKKGELAAKELLLEKGYQILEENWRYRNAEVDLIASISDVIVFVEVKSRSSKTFGLPQDFVSKKKINLLSKSASAYMDLVNHNWEIRFDIIAISFYKEEVTNIEHLEDAFFPSAL